MATPNLQMMEQYLRVLFDSGEYVCPSNDARDTGLFTMDEVIAHGAATEFVCVNPFIPGTKRLDANVQTFRSILIEIDTLDLNAQEKLVEVEYAMPFSLKTFSGGKSYHYVIVMDKPFETVEAYKEAAQGLLDVLEVADTKCKNPSRFTRMAGAIRLEKDSALQELKMVKGRVNASELAEFMYRFQDKAAAARAKREEVLSKVSVVAPEELPEGTTGRLSLRTKTYLKDGSTKGSRNDDLFFAACDFKNNLFPMEEAMNQLMPVAKASGLSNWEINQAIRSAYRVAGVRPRIT